MGFRYRKSINLGGGFRINLSKSGVGYSWGTKGFRVSKSANGKIRRTYSIPGTGISYTEDVGSSKKGAQNNRPVTPNRRNIQQTHQLNTMHDITSADISSFKAAEVDNVSDAIEKTLKVDFLATILIWCTLLSFGNPFFIIFPVIGIALKIYVRKNGRVELEYSFDAEKEDEHNRRIGAWELLAEGKKEWQILSEQFNSNKKVNAGAGRSIKREPCDISKKCPFYIRTNVNVISIRLKKETLVIMPDKVFVIRNRKVGSIEYADFRISVSQVRYIEDEPVPKDARIVGQTWKYVNKNGTPDKRYKDNKQYPICLYGQVFLRSNSGLNVEMQISNVQNAIDFGELIE